MKRRRAGGNRKRHSGLGLTEKERAIVVNNLHCQAKEELHELRNSALTLENKEKRARLLKLRAEFSPIVYNRIRPKVDAAINHGIYTEILDIYSVSRSRELPMEKRNELLKKLAEAIVYVYIHQPIFHCSFQNELQKQNQILKQSAKPLNYSKARLEKLKTAYEKERKADFEEIRRMAIESDLEGKTIYTILGDSAAFDAPLASWYVEHSKTLSTGHETDACFFLMLTLCMNGAYNLKMRPEDPVFTAKVGKYDIVRDFPCGNHAFLEYVSKNEKRLRRALKKLVKLGIFERRGNGYFATDTGAKTLKHVDGHLSFPIKIQSTEMK